MALTKNQMIVSDLADCLGAVPPSIDQSYVESVSRAGAFLGQKTLSIGIADTADDVQRSNFVFSTRNDCITIVAAVNDFVARARDSGFQPPDNPFSLIDSLNIGRSFGNPIFVSTTVADDIVFNTTVFLDLIKAEKEKKINLEHAFFSSAQLSSCNIVLDGLSSGENTAAELMKYLPDSDMNRQKKADDTLAALDFSRRVPRVIFTADYNPDGTASKGALIGWRRMLDASGYIVRRRDVFDGTDKIFSFTNSQIISKYYAIQDFVAAWVLSFYDKYDRNDVYAFVDTDVVPDSEYVYVVQAYQNKMDPGVSIFGVHSDPLSLPAVQRSEGLDELRVIAVNGLGRNFGSDDISPYPMISEKIYGDSRYDWVLAGINTAMAVVRGDDRSVVRDYSYLGARASFIFSRMDEGKFFVPENIETVVTRVKDSVTNFGFSQTISSLLKDTGTLFFFEGKDSPADDSFTRAGSGIVSKSNLLLGVLSSIDPETATIDIATLSSNLPLILSGKLVISSVPKGSVVDAAKRDRVTTGLEIGPEEIEVPSFNIGSNAITDTEASTLVATGTAASGFLDLTTFDGIGGLIRKIREFSDFSFRGVSPEQRQKISAVVDKIATQVQPTTDSIASTIASKKV